MSPFARSLSAICHTEESLARLEPLQRRLISNLANRLAEVGIGNLFEAKQYIWKTMMDQGVEVHSDIFQQLEADDSIEMWTQDWRFLFAMGPVLSLSSYSLQELATAPWSQLFARDDEPAEQILSAFDMALMTEQSVHDVTDWHQVRELRAARESEFFVKVRLVAPFKSKDGVRGIFGVVKARRRVSEMVNTPIEALPAFPNDKSEPGPRKSS